MAQAVWRANTSYRLNGVIEYQQLTMSKVEVVVKSDTAPTALATCKLTGWRCSDQTLACHRISSMVPR